ncbi:hypothetical protein NUSPORA_02458 [Nucleospora cyclopteri]
MEIKQKDKEIDYFDPSYEDLMNENEYVTYYEEVKLQNFTFNKDTGVFTYPCPCGDVFIITLPDLEKGEMVAECFSCSLKVICLYKEDDLLQFYE